jgi:hypothetical protein
VDVVHQTGWTALHCATDQGRVGCVEQLLANGADDTIFNSRGFAALDLAKSIDNTNPALIAVLTASISGGKAWKALGANEQMLNTRWELMQAQRAHAVTSAELKEEKAKAAEQTKAMDECCHDLANVLQEKMDLGAVLTEEKASFVSMKAAMEAVLKQRQHLNTVMEASMKTERQLSTEAIRAEQQLRETLRQEADGEKQQTQARFEKEKQQLQARCDKMRNRLAMSEDKVASLTQLQKATASKLEQDQRVRRRLEQELKEASTLATLSAADQVPGLADAELRALEEAVRAESVRRQRLEAQAEARREMQAETRLEMRREMQAELERERVALRHDGAVEAMQCQICLDKAKNINYNW